MKYRILVIIIMLVTLLCGTGATYSFFYSGTELYTMNQKIAKFVFETEKLDHIELPLSDLLPGSVENYTFLVSNNVSDVVSNVTVDYQITVKTYHFMPLDIELFKITEDGEESIMVCDESYSRNEKKEMICNSPVQEMTYSSQALDSYKIVVTFPEEYNSLEYAELVDFLDLEIKSWQKMSSNGGENE